MSKSQKILWILFFVLLFLNSNSQTEAGIGASLTSFENNNVGMNKSFGMNGNGNNGIIGGNVIQSGQNNYLTLQHGLNANVGTTPVGATNFNNFLTPNNYQAVNTNNIYPQNAVTTSLTPPLSLTSTTLNTQMDTIILGINKTISLYSNQTANYLMPMIESKKQNVLFFVVNPQTDITYEQTSLKISLKGNQTLVNQCSDVGVNVCLIPGELLKLGDQLIISIKCVSDETCLFTLETYWSTTYPLHFNRVLSMDFEQDAYAKLFHLDVTNKNFKQVRIQLTTKTILDGNAPIHMYANMGTQPPTKQKHDFAGIHLWDDGLGIFIDKSLFNQTQLTIIVEGPAGNVLQLVVKVITQYYNTISFNQIQYDYLPHFESRVYYVTLPTVLSDMRLKLSTFSGNVGVDFYKDQNLKQPVMVGQFQAFGDRLYHLSASHLIAFNVTGRLFIKVKNQYMPSTYTLKLTSSNQTSIQLSTDISDMAQLKKGQIINYHINTYLESSSILPKILKFNIHHLAGNNAPVFRICHQQQASKCYVDYNTYINNKSVYDQIKPKTIATSGNTAIYKVTLQPNLFLLDSHSLKFKRAILSIIFAEQKDRFLYGIEYSDNSIIKTLKQGTPVKDRVYSGSNRLYKVAPLSKDVIAVHIHLVQIVGKVQMFGSKIDPRLETFDTQTMDVSKKKELVYQTQFLNVNHTIFIMIQGQQNAVFSLTATFKRSVEISQSNQFKDKFNYIAIPVNTQQQITIQPQSYQVIFISTSNSPHEFTYSTSFALKLCARKDNTVFPREPNCDINITQRKIQLPASKSYYISIGNPGNTTAVISVKYHNVYHCQEKNLGSLWKKYLQKPETSNCVKYTIHKNQSLQVLTSIDTYSYPNMHSIIYINQFEVQLNQPYIFIDSKAFEQHCNPTYCVVTILFSNLTKSNVQMVVQYIDHEITLLDGISQQVHSVASPNVYKKFIFHLPNKQQTTIILQSKEGTFDFFVSIHDEYEGHLNQEIYPTRQTSMFKGNITYYSLFKTQIITVEDLKKLQCTNCILYITVTGTQTGYNEKGRFVIQVTQQRRTLKALELTPGYLSINSLHYYEYQFKNEHGSLVISLSTQNTNCANTYVIRGKDKSNPMTKTAKSSSDETIVNAVKGIYTIVLQATINCKYTISISQTLIKISQIKQGIYKDLTLNKDQIAYLFYHHAVDTAFKVLSLQQYGQLMISVTTVDRTAIQSLGNITNIDDKVLKKFQWSGGKDVIRVLTTDKGYCNNCYYLIYIKAMKNTYTSIILATTNIQIPLSQNDQITDMMGENQTMFYKMYTYNPQSLNVSIFVHYGQLQVSVIGIQNNSKTFKKSNQSQVWAVTLSPLDTLGYSPTHFHVHSKQNSMYRLIIKGGDHLFSNQSFTKQMKFGYPTYLYLGSNKSQSCASAVYSQSSQQLLISTSRQQKNKLNNLNFTVKIGSTTISNTTYEIIENTMVIKFLNSEVFPQNQKINITYCFISQKDSYVSLTLIPVATVTFLPQNSQVAVNKESNLTLNADGKFFVEIFQCQGNTNVLLSKKFIKLKGGISQLLHWRRFGANYLIELDEKGLIYMNVDGEKTLVRWQHIDRTKGQGLGYYYFSPPHFTYNVNNNKISFQVPALIQMQPLVNKTVVQGINYTLMISDTKTNLKRGIQCNIGTLLGQNQYLSSSQINKTLTMQIQISDIKKRYSNRSYIFVSIIAQVTLITPTNKTQVYKFIYQDQQILFINNGLLTKEEESTQKYGIWFWILWSATLIVIALYFITKMAIAKYKSRHMSLTQGTDIEINEVDSVR